MDNKKGEGFLKSLITKTSGKFFYGAAVLAGSLLLSIGSALAVFSPGETLDPNCQPTDPNCTVAAPAASGANSDITSLSGLTTALSVSQGGTGLSSIAANSLIYSPSANTLTTLAAGTEGQILKIVDGNLTWANGSGSSYLAGNGLTLTDSTFTLDLTDANTWSGLQTFSSGISVGGNVFTSLVGTGLSFSSGTLSTTLGTSISSAEIVDSTIATDDIADSALTFAKFAQNGCAAGKVMKWSGSAWTCGDDSSNTYGAGSGLALSSSTFSLNINGLTANSSVAMDDYIPMYDSSAGANVKVSRNDLLAPVLGALNYRGTWDASATSTPPGVTCDESNTKGYYYVVTTAGNGYAVNDWTVCNGTNWDKLTSTSALASVFGRTGVVTAQSGDYSASQITNTPSGGIGSTNVQTALNELDSDKQAVNSLLTAIAGLTPSDGNFIVGNGASFTAENGGTARASLGLGTLDSPTFAGITVGGDTVSDFNGAGLSLSSGVLMVADNGIINSKIADSTISFAKLASNSCSSGQVPKYNGSAWVCASDNNDGGTNGNLSSSTSGITITGGTGAVLGSGATINIATADATHTGLITSTDWNTFNSKQSALTIGSISSSTTGVTVSGGSNAVIGSGVTLTIANAGASTTGLVTSTDWNTFNGKQDSLGTGTTGEYLRGDKTWQTLNKTAVGLSNVENTALSTWTGSTNITTLGTIATGVWHGTDIVLGNYTSGNYVATLASGTGLSGGSSGSEGAALTLSLDINGLTGSSAVASDDYVPMFDTSASGIVKVSRTDFLSGVTGALNYQGTWDNSATATPETCGTGIKGHYWVATVDSQNGYNNKDWAICNGTSWEKLTNSNNVASVFGRTGAVTANSGDYTALKITNAASGNIASTDVQSAISELDSEKLAIDGSITSLDVPDYTGNAGKVLAVNGTNDGVIWASALTNTLGSKKILVGSITNQATAVDVSGDVTIANDGTVSIGVDKVTNAMLAGSIDDSKLSTVTTANKVSGSAIQLGTNSGLQDSTGLVLKLNGSTLALGASGLSIDLSNANTWTGAQTFSSAIVAPTSSNTINGLVINSGSLSAITGFAQASGNFAQSGTGTFGTGTGAVSLNGNTTVATGKTLSLTDITQGSILFAGASGVVSQSNSNFFWDNTNSRLGIGTNAPTSALTFASGSTIDSLGSLSLTTASNGALSLASNGTGAATLDSGTTGDVNVGTGTNAKNIYIGNSTGATQLALASGSGGISLAGNTTLTGYLAAKKGSDFSTTGTSSDVNFGNASLIRLTGASAQTIDSIAAGADGRMLTIVNAGANSATIRDNSTAIGTDANKIYTGTGSNLSLAADASVLLVYDSGASRWRVVGGTGGSGGGSNLIQSMASTGNVSGWGYTVKGDATSGSVVATLPTASGNSGKSIEVMKTDNSTNFVKISAYSGETIDGQTKDIYLYNQGESAVFRSDGANVLIVSQNKNGDVATITNWQTDTFSIESTGTAPSGGTVTINKMRWRRVGQNMEIEYDYNMTAAGNVGSGTYLLPIPSGYNIDTTNLVLQTATSGSVPTQGATNIGYGYADYNQSEQHRKALTAYVWGGATQNKLNIAQTEEDTETHFVAGSNWFENQARSFSLHVSIPIQGWSAMGTNVVSTVEYVKVNRTTDLAATPNTSIVFDQTEAGNIPYNSTNGQFTLKAGKTYLLNATAALTGSVGAFDFQWRTTAGTLLGSTATAYGYNKSTVPAVAIFTPSTDTTVTVYMTAEGDAAVMRGGYVQATIQQIGSTASTGVALNSIISATASGALDNQNYAQTWAWSTADDETGLSMTGNALTTGGLLSLTSSNATLNSTNGLLYVANTGASTTGMVARIQSNSTAGSGLTVLANGTVGVGVTSTLESDGSSGGTLPTYLKIVTGGTTNTRGLTLMQPNLAVGNGVSFGMGKETAANNSFWETYTHAGDGSTSNRLGFGVYGGSDILTLLASGNVGIGTTSPTATLDVAGTISTSNGTNGYMTMNTDAADRVGFLEWRLGDGTRLGFMGDATSDVTLALENSANFNINGGNVGIGTDDPLFALSVSDAANSEYVTQLINTGTTPHGMQIQLISPVSGSNFVGFFNSSASVGGIAYNGTGVNYNQTSDQRLKENIVDTHYSVLDLMKINVRDFDYKSDPSGQTINGFIAQELQKIYPDAVTVGNDEVDDNGNLVHPWMVDYGRLTPLIIKSIQDQQAEIEANVESIVALDLRTKNVVNVEDGKTVFKGMVVADTIKANRIEGLDFVSGSEMNDLDAQLVAHGETLSDISQQLALLEAKITSKELSLKLEDLEVSGGVTFKSDVEFRGPAVFKEVAEFIDKVVFKDDVEFAGNVMVDKKLTFNNDTAGYAVIKAGKKKVDVVFEKEYAATPIITATLKSGVKLDWYRVTDESTKGFTIEIDPEKDKDIKFAWTAVAVKDAKTTESDEPVNIPEDNDAPAEVIDSDASQESEVSAGSGDSTADVTDNTASTGQTSDSNEVNPSEPDPVDTTTTDSDDSQNITTNTQTN